MKIIGLNGSPRKKSNTRFLLEQALAQVKEDNIDFEIIDVYETLKTLQVPFCIHCSSPCNRSCYKGTQLEKDFEKLSTADGLILASPVYFGTVSAPLKAFWDKTRALRTDHKLVGKIGGAISVGASLFGGQETTIRALQDMMLIQGMTIVGDGLLNVSVGHQGACCVNPASENTLLLNNVAHLGARISAEIKRRGN
ncbi:MAG: flavodoxin family protein [Candidatus Marinimicrobia bacterium]|nr:flavodoxin family protein [Candidatus Neomarinimicrobiota bacterium]